MGASVYEAKSVETISTKIAEQIGRCDRSYGFTEMALEIGERHADPLYFDAYEKLRSRFPEQLNQKRDNGKRSASGPPTHNKDEPAPSSQPVRKKRDIRKRPNSEPPTPNKGESAPRPNLSCNLSLS